MNDNNRRFFSPEQKVAILLEHLVEGKAVSDLCEKHRIHPTVFYQWQRQFFENGTAAFESKQSRSRVSDGYQKKLQALEQKLYRTLVGTHRDRGPAANWLDRFKPEQVLLLARSLRQNQRTRRSGSARSLAGAVGEGCHYQLPSRVSAGGLPPADFHDAGS